MKARILDGKKLSSIICADLGKNIETVIRKPCLVVILVGNDQASKIYVKNKGLACSKVGIDSKIIKLNTQVKEQELLKHINLLNEDDTVDGILVQLPLPKHIEVNNVLNSISTYKDVDGFHPYNMGSLSQGRPLFRSCTPYGIMQLLATTNINLKGQNAVIVGASNIVGRPMAFELLNAGCTVTICHKFTKNLSEQINKAEILISAVGKAKFIEGNWIKDDAVVIDVGINLNEQGKLCGDIDFETAQNKASWITPVPGGVGPMTIASLLQNTYQAFKFHKK